MGIDCASGREVALLLVPIARQPYVAKLVIKFSAIAIRPLVVPAKSAVWSTWIGKPGCGD